LTWPFNHQFLPKSQKPLHKARTPPALPPSISIISTTQEQAHLSLYIYNSTNHSQTDGILIIHDSVHDISANVHKILYRFNYKASHSHSLYKNVQLHKNTPLQRPPVGASVKTCTCTHSSLALRDKTHPSGKNGAGGICRGSGFMLHVAHQTGPYNHGFDTYVTLSKSRCIRLVNSCLCARIHLRSFFVLVLSVHFFLSRWEGKK
jgi:hypothetical protein